MRSTRACLEYFDARDEVYLKNRNRFDNFFKKHY